MNQFFIDRGWRVTSPFGWRRDPETRANAFHRGVDLAQPHRSPIQPFVPGEVVFAGDGSRRSGLGPAYGLLVIIKDNHDHLHLYTHLDEVWVKVGTRVSVEDTIGLQGQTGRATGSHLHYEVRTRTTPAFGWETHRNPGTYVQEWHRREDALHAPSDWAIEAWTWAIHNGITDGRRPRDTATREQMVTMLYRAHQVRGQ